MATAMNQPVGVITISSIACRRVSIPPTCEDLFVATVRIGSQTYLTNPVRVMNDPIVGMTLQFSEMMECRLDRQYDIRQGVFVSISSVSEQVHLGSAWCHAPRDWVGLTKPRGEVQVAFHQGYVSKSMLSTSSRPQSSSVGGGPSTLLASLTSRPGSSSGGGALVALEKSAATTRPSTAGSSVGISYSNPRQVYDRPEHAPVRTVVFSSIRAERLAFSSEDEEPLFLTVVFAHQERQTPVNIGKLGASGHEVTFDGTLAFDVPAFENNYGIQVKLWHGNNRSTGRIVGHGTTSSDPGLPGPRSCLVFLAQLPHSRVHFDVETHVTAPLVEGARGRPMSAFTRKNVGATPLTSEGSGHQPPSPRRPQTAAARSSLKKGSHQSSDPSKKSVTEIPVIPPPPQRGYAPELRQLASPSKPRRLEWTNEDETPDDGADLGIADDDGGDSVASDEELEAFRAAKEQRSRELQQMHAEARACQKQPTRSVATASTRQPQFRGAQQQKQQPRRVQSAAIGVLSSINERTPKGQGLRLDASATAEEDADDSYYRDIPDDNSPVEDETDEVDSGLQIEQGSGKAKAMAADFERALVEIEASLRAQLSTALQPVMHRLGELEARLISTEMRVNEMVMPRSSATPGDGVSRGASPSPDSQNGGPPSSTAPPPGYDNTSFGGGTGALTSEDELRATYEQYLEMAHGSSMTVSQLVHFYRTHNSFAMDDSLDTINRELRKVVSQWDNDAVSYDEFCLVALRLAKL